LRVGWGAGPAEIKIRIKTGLHPQGERRTIRATSMAKLLNGKLSGKIRSDVFVNDPQGQVIRARGKG